jgi:hypothetical protein
MGNSTTIRRDYYECSRCKINSETEKRMCPCPRNLNCDAELKGEVFITKTIYLTEEKLKPRNNHNSDDIGQMTASMNL